VFSIKFEQFNKKFEQFYKKFEQFNHFFKIKTRDECKNNQSISFQFLASQETTGSATSVLVWHVPRVIINPSGVKLVVGLVLTTPQRTLWVQRHP
jgi:hypothetical protein